MERYDAIIIGAGPSGMTAALEAKRLAPHLSVLIIEKNEEVGRKLRATGNGRCNITNVEADGYMQCLEFFRRIGLALRQYENGLAYPYSESAADVAELLADKLKDFGIELMLGASVTGVEKNAEGFVVSGEGFVVSGDSLVLATGGKAGPNYGCTGDGYKFARNFGHTVVSPVPVLTSVECEEDCSRLGGNRARGKVTLLRDGEPVFMENGEIQFTKSGLSGICVFNMSRFMKSGSRDLSMFDIELDLYADGDIREFLRDRMKEESSEDFDSGIVGKVLRGLLKPALANYALEKAGVDTEKPVSEISDNDIDAIAKAVHSLQFKPVSVKGWKDAQCTSGGVSLEEIDETTCESKVVSNLYITGELMDYDGPCGGFNLTNAWVSGMKAGKAIGR